MGYCTDFEGKIMIDPPLNEVERDYLTLFAHTRHMHRAKGPFYVDGISSPVEENTDIIDYNAPPPGQPSLWCDFEPTVDGSALEWNGSEKTQCAKEWIEYLITRFLEMDAVLSEQSLPEFAGFKFNHILNGTLEAQGEEPSDRWKLIVKNNKVTIKKGRTVYR